MSTIKGLSIGQMTGRILRRRANIYDKKTVKDVLKMYMDECRKALIKGERVQITGVGTIIPEVKTHMGNYQMSIHNKDDEKSPYTKIKISRNMKLRNDMLEALLSNIENGIYGLEKLPFNAQQIYNLKANGFIFEDEQEMDNEEGE